MTNYNSYTLSKRERIRFALAVLAGCTALGYVFYRSFFALILFPLIYGKCEKLYRHYMAERRKKNLLVQFKDFLYLISSALAAGNHMITAMKEARDGLDRIYPESEIVMELDSIVDKVEEAGADEADALKEFSLRTGLEDIEDFTQVYQCCRQSGGNLIEAVNRAATVIGEKIAVESEIRKIGAQKKLEGRVISAMPIGIIVFLQIVSPDYLNIMYESLAGRILMTGALVASVIAYVAIERITDIEI
ncbi:MAG: type II secretion system F family protein [Clostridia bacterium]|nr:type II secretion system F family protein [Clostridia bacterium]